MLAGSQTIDHAAKDMHKRMDRVSISFPITSTTILVLSPLGGSLFLLVR